MASFLIWASDKPLVCQDGVLGEEIGLLLASLSVWPLTQSIVLGSRSVMSF